MRGVLVALTVALAGCGSSAPSDEEIDRISDISGPAAEAAINGSEKINAIEERLDAVEGRLDRAQIAE